MWGTLFKQASRLAQEGYSREEVREILRRAAELQMQVEKEQEKESRINKDALKAGASAAGIRPEFLEQALREFNARRQREEGKRQTQGKNWNKFAGLTLAAIFGLPIALFVLGTLAFAFGLTVSILLTVAVALGIAGLALLFASPFIGFGLIVGLAAFIGHAIGKWKGHGRGRRKWRHWFEDDDDD